MIKTVKTFKGNEERAVLSALITHDRVLERVVTNLAGEQSPFRSKWSNTVFGWCSTYFDKYHKAPRKAVQSLFEKYARSTRDQESVEIIESFLEGLSGEFAQKDGINEEYVIDMASFLFRKVRLEKLQRKLEASLEKDDVTAAEASLEDYQPVAFASSDWVDPTDPKVIVDSLQTTEKQTIIQFRGDLGRFLSPYFERDGFVSFVGPEKRGKSFWLMETAWAASCQGRRVLYYVVGDMSRPQVMRRLLTRAIRRPLSAGRIEKPKEIRKLSGGKVKVLCSTYEYEDTVSISQAVKEMKLLMKRTGAATSRLKLRCTGPSTLTATDIDNDIRKFLRAGWVPDVLVIDYLDLLAPEVHTRQWEYRHQVNETWKVIRRITQEHHLLAVTGTQAAATSYDSVVIKKKDFSEDKRKNAHVTGMLGINQTAEEKIQGVYRLNWVFLRDGHWADTQVVYTAGSLALACPCIVSRI